jgi:Tfp pilus assembly protein PilZ
MSGKEIVIEYDEVEDLEKDYAENLRHGGTFARKRDGFAQGDACELVLIHPRNGARIGLPAQVVLAVPEGAQKGLGIALSDFDGEMRKKLEGFINDPSQPSRTSIADTRPVAERLRGLSVTEQHKIAGGGNVNERVVLERIYGKAVWEPLLRNPRITPPEVARIARMGSIPLPQLDMIVSNGAWVRAPQVRRALLSNPRLSGEAIKRVLRAIPRHELKLVPRQTAYSAAVRDAARRLLSL